MNWVDRILILLTLALASLMAFCYMAVFNPRVQDPAKQSRVVSRCMHMKEMVESLKEFAGGLEITVALANATMDHEANECKLEKAFGIDHISDVLIRQCGAMEKEINEIIREIKYT